MILYEYQWKEARGQSRQIQSNKLRTRVRSTLLKMILNVGTLLKFNIYFQGYD
jgi:hypothetical protein